MTETSREEYYADDDLEPNLTVVKIPTGLEVGDVVRVVPDGRPHDPWGGRIGVVTWCIGEGTNRVYDVRFDSPHLRNAVFAATEVELLE